MPNNQISSLNMNSKFKRTPIGNLPVDWDAVALGEITEDICRYHTYYGIEYTTEGVPEIRGELIKSNGQIETDIKKFRFISSETAKRFPRTSLNPGDFVLSVRGTLGKIGIIPQILKGANITANLIRIAPRRDRVYPLWLLHLLLSEHFQNALDTASSSTTIKTITAPALKNITIPYPPLKEQRLMADLLNIVDLALEKSSAVIEKTKQLKKGLMQQLLTKGIRHKEFKKTEIGRIPKSWKMVTLGDITDDIYRYPTYYNIAYCTEGIPEIRGELIKNNGQLETDLSQYRFISNDTATKFPRTMIKKGDFVLSVRGTIGKVAIVPPELKGANITANLIRIAPSNEIVDSRWLLQVFLSESFQNALEMASSSTTIKTITSPALQALEIPLPAISEQKEIAEILSSTDRSIEREEAFFNNLSRIKSTLMQLLLTGKVRTI